MWQFTKHIPDKEDCPVLNNEIQKYAKKAIPAQYGGPDWFSAGFWRGTAWGKHRERMRVMKKMNKVLEKLSKIFDVDVTSLKPEEKVNLLIEQQNIFNQFRNILFPEGE